MGMRAKFKVSQINQFETQKQIIASAIYGHEGENADFTKYTPSGKLEMLVTNEAPASEYMRPGDEFYLTFEKIDK